MAGRQPKNKIKWLLSALFFVLIFGFSPKAVAAQNTVLINEVMWRGSGISSADEWVELYNNSQNDVDISGYQLFDEVENEVMVSIAQLQTIKAHSFYLISNNKKDHSFSKGESILNVDPDLVSSKVGLSNSEFKLSLRNQENTLLDVAGNGKKPFFGEYQEQISSMQRINYTSDGSMKDSWAASMQSKNLDAGRLEFATPGDFGAVVSNLALKNKKFPTGSKFLLKFDYIIFDPGEEFKNLKVSLINKGKVIKQVSGKIGDKTFTFDKAESCPQAEISFGELIKQVFDLICYQTSDKVKFWEILTSPKDQDWDRNGQADSHDEWFELKNQSGQSIDLNGWQVRDKSGKSAMISGSIKPGGFKVFFYKDTKISLNNSGEELFLYDPVGKLLDKISIAKLDYNFTFARFEHGWNETKKPTPANENVLEVEESNSEQERSQTDNNVTKSKIRTVKLTKKNSEQTEEKIVTVVTTTTKIPAELAVFKRANRSVLPKIDGGIVLGSTDERGQQPSKIRINLIYFVSILAGLITILLIIISTHGIYRRE